MAGINLTLLIILNVNKLNFPNKRQRLEEQIKNMIQLYVLYKRIILDSKHKKVENKSMEEIYHGNSNQKITSGYTNIRQIRLRTKIVTKNKKGYFIMTTGQFIKRT